MANEQQQIDTNSLGFEQRKFAYEMLRKELESCRDKAWKVFSWTSTILLGTIGGLVAVTGKPDSSTPASLPCWPHRTLLLAAILVLAFYASLWVRQNLKAEEDVLKRIEPFEVEIGIRGKQGTIYGKPWFGYRLTIALLAIAALVSICFIPYRCFLC